VKRTESIIEEVTAKQEITALRRLLHEALAELKYLQLAHPELASSRTSGI